MQEGLYCQQDERRLNNVQGQAIQVETRVTVGDRRPNINDERRERQDYQGRSRQLYQVQDDLERKYRNKEAKKALKLVERKLEELKLAKQQVPEMAPDINTTPQLQAHQVQPTKLQAYTMEQKEHPTRDALVEQKTKQQEECRKHGDLAKEIGQQEEYHRPKDVTKKLENKREERKHDTLAKEQEARKRSALIKEQEARKRNALRKEREEHHEHKDLLEQSEAYSALPTQTQQEEKKPEREHEYNYLEEIRSFDSNESSSSSVELGSEDQRLLERIQTNQNRLILNAFKNNVPSVRDRQEQVEEKSKEIKERIQRIREKLSLITEEDRTYSDLEEKITETAIKLHDECLDAFNSRLVTLLRKF